MIKKFLNINLFIDAPGTAGPVEGTTIQLIKINEIDNSTVDRTVSTLISDASKIVGLDMAKSQESDTKQEINE